MRYNYGQRKRQKAQLFELQKAWHVWFAWRPVRGAESLMWLEYVWRRNTRVHSTLYADWEYHPR